MSTCVVAGCMTGTSCDGVDAALIAIEGEWPRPRIEVLETASVSLGRVGQEVYQITQGELVSVRKLRELLADMAEIHVQALRKFSQKPVFIAVHGQTVMHAPPLSWQPVDAPRIAQKLGVPVVSDLRAPDLLSGGEGAPMTPLADLSLFASSKEDRVIINLGGFINISVLPRGCEPAQLGGGDVCACNHLLDGYARDLLGQAYDGDGATALKGSPNPHWVETAVAALQQQSQGDRSLGTGDEKPLFRHAQGDDAAEILASVCEAIAKVVVLRIAEENLHDPVLICAGGGVANKALMQALVRNAPGKVLPSDAFGVPAAFREAVAMAILGHRSYTGLPVTIPSITLAPRASAGGTWTFPGPPQFVRPPPLSGA